MEKLDVATGELARAVRNAGELANTVAALCGALRAHRGPAGSPVVLHDDMAAVVAAVASAVAVVEVRAHQRGLPCWHHHVPAHGVVPVADPTSALCANAVQAVDSAHHATSMAASATAGAVAGQRAVPESSTGDGDGDGDGGRRQRRRRHWSKPPECIDPESVTQRGIHMACSSTLSPDDTTTPSHVAVEAALLSLETKLGRGKRFSAELIATELKTLGHKTRFGDRFRSKYIERCGFMAFCRVPDPANSGGYLYCMPKAFRAKAQRCVADAAMEMQL